MVQTWTGVFSVSLLLSRLCFLSLSLQVWQSSDSVVNVCSQLDWKRCVAVHLWFMLPPTASVADALAKYEAAFQVSCPVAVFRQWLHVFSEQPRVK